MQTHWFFTHLVCCTLLAAGLMFAPFAAANPDTSVYLLEMPEESIDYTVSWINGSLWATVDGTYPLIKAEIECDEQTLSDDITGFMFSGDSLMMVYPTPPGTTNIAIKAEDIELEWSNYTQIFPAQTHYTAIGDWTMINCTIHSVLDQFVLEIHYEHPIRLTDEGYTFLYDLNISPYLSPWSNKSVAHFTITFEADVTDIQARTIATDETQKTVAYNVTREADTEPLTLQVVSEYAKPLPGDLLISFDAKEETQQNDSGLGSVEQLYVLAAVTVAAVVAAYYLLLKHRQASRRRLSG